MRIRSHHWREGVRRGRSDRGGSRKDEAISPGNRWARQQRAAPGFCVVGSSNSRRSCLCSTVTAGLASNALCCILQKLTVSIGCCALFLWWDQETSFLELRVCLSSDRQLLKLWLWETRLTVRKQVATSSASGGGIRLQEANTPNSKARMPMPVLMQHYDPRFEMEQGLNRKSCKQEFL